MGIHGFYSWLTKQPYFKELRSYNPPEEVSSISVDLNSLIHEGAQIVFAYGAGDNDNIAKVNVDEDPSDLMRDVETYVGSRIMDIMIRVKPRDVAIIAVDGPAPQAKLQQQRQRRELASMSRANAFFDSNAISPGTEFMIRLDRYLKRYFKKYRHLFPPKLYYSSHLMPGEGEHKIMDLYRSGFVDGFRGAHIVYGMDADLVMLTMIASARVPRLTLWRDDPDHPEFIDISLFRRFLARDMTPPTETQISEAEMTQISDDFVIGMYLSGNDFVPRIFSLENMEQSLVDFMEIYRLQRQNVGSSWSLTKGSRINWANFSILLNFLREREVAYLTQMAGRAPMGATLANSFLTGQSTVDYDRFRTLWYDKVLRPKQPEGIPVALQSVVYGDEYMVTQEGKMLGSYLEMISWVNQYYHEGTSRVNQTISYPFHYAPTLNDLADGVAQLAELSDDPTIIPRTQGSLSALFVLLAVLPRSSVDLLPSDLRPLMREGSPILDLYPTGIEIDSERKFKSYENIALIPPINTKRIVQAIDGIFLASGRETLYQERTWDDIPPLEHGTKIVYKRDLIYHPLRERQRVPIASAGAVGPGALTTTQTEAGRRLVETGLGRGGDRGRGSERSRGRGESRGRGRGSRGPKMTGTGPRYTHLNPNV